MSLEAEFRPPTAERIAARACVLAAVACRGSIEKDAAHSGADRLRVDINEWLKRIGVADELENREAELLAIPVGQLDKRQAVDSTWVSEAMVVLAWALHSADLPNYYTQCDSPNVANRMGFLAPRDRTVLSKLDVRRADEIEKLTNTYLTLHWRLRNFLLAPGDMGFPAFVATCKWGPLTLNGVEIVEGDLAIHGTPVNGADYTVLKQTLSIVQERHQALNWLMGWNPVYSQVTTDT